MAVIPAELLKHMGQGRVLWLLELINMLWNGQDIPRLAKGFHMPHLQKLELKTECSNYRGVYLMSHAFKTYEKKCL